MAFIVLYEGIRFIGLYFSLLLCFCNWRVALYYYYINQSFWIFGRALLVVMNDKEVTAGPVIMSDKSAKRGSADSHLLLFLWLLRLR